MQYLIYMSDSNLFSIVDDSNECLQATDWTATSYIFKIIWSLKANIFLNTTDINDWLSTRPTCKILFSANIITKEDIYEHFPEFLI